MIDKIIVMVKLLDWYIEILIEKASEVNERANKFMCNFNYVIKTIFPRKILVKQIFYVRLINNKFIKLGFRCIYYGNIKSTEH